MRIALVAAASAVCFAVPAFAASTADRIAAAQAAAGDQNFRLYAQVAPVSTRTALAATPRLRFEKKMLEYFPLEGSGLHFEAGFARERLGARSGFRGDRLFGFGNNLGLKRKVSPGFAVAYDRPVGAHDKIDFDLGLRYSRNAMAAQLNRLAALGPEQYRLGARASRFGPAAHLSFTHVF